MLSEQNRRSLERDPEVERNLHELKEIAYKSRDALVAGDLRRFAELLSFQWEQKKRRTGGASNDEIDRLYQLGMENGALGGKLVGAGGGGFLMFYAEDKIPAAPRHARGRPARGPLPLRLRGHQGRHPVMARSRIWSTRRSHTRGAEARAT